MLSAQPKAADFTGPEPSPTAQVSPVNGAERPAAKKRGKAKLFIWLLVAAMAVAGIAYAATLPPVVKLVTPTKIRITESIAVTGSVKGRKESGVGAQLSGTVETLLVREGDHVRKGQLIATIHNDAADAAVAQALQSVATSRAQLAQAQMKPLASDVRALREKVAQADQVLLELRARSKKTEVSVAQARSAIRQSQNQLKAAMASLADAQAQLELAQKNYERANTLYEEGAIAKQQLDGAEASYKAAQASVDAAQSAIDIANTAIATARDTEQGALLDVDAMRSQITQAASARDAARAQYQSLLQQPLEQNVEVFRQRLQDAQAALRTARAQAQNARVLAPYDGLITEVLSELGASANPAGIVKIAEMAVPQISANLDENDMADLRLGQKVLVSSAANPNDTITGRVLRIGPQVDFSRGTVEVRIAPDRNASWLMPGQTVSVNLINHENIERLAVPVSAVRQEANGSVVLVVKDGRTEPRSVQTGPAVDSRVPILSGLNENDQILANAEKIASNTRVRVAR